MFDIEFSDNPTVVGQCKLVRCVVINNSYIEALGGLYGGEERMIEAYDCHFEDSCEVHASNNLKLYNCQLSDEACINVVSGLTIRNACFRGNAYITRSSDYMTIGPVGTERGTLTIHKDTQTKDRLLINRGCFTGTYEEFMDNLNVEFDEHAHYKMFMPSIYNVMRERVR